MKYDFLTVIKKAYQKPSSRWVYECLCDCGNVTFRAMNQLTNSRVSSCGCQRGKAIATHGMRYTRVYRIWKGMKERCLNPNNKDFKKYSKFGLCKRWDQFEFFLLDMGEPPTSKHQIDRVDNTDGYRKSNCKWSTVSEQARNTSRSRIWTAEGVEFKSIGDVAEKYGVTKASAHRWFNGYVSRGKTYPPKNNFTSKKVY